MTNTRYEIGESIGAGGLGAVYKALDTQLQREVAIKRILSTEHASEEEVEVAGEKLLAEAQTLSLLNHPNIVTVFDVGQDDKGGFVVMELLNGETLDDTVARGVLTQEDFTEVVTQTMEALIAAHALNILHRDLKPPNVMVIWQPSGKFQTKILDFGLAKFSKSPSVQTMDQEDAVMGSIFFMAPEQFERAELDFRTDLYQIGCVYYHALTGQYPFRGETAPQVMNAHLQHRVTPLEKLRPDLAPSICQWVMWLINRDMENRPKDSREALEYYPKNPEAVPAQIPVVVEEPKPTTGATTVKIVAAPTHDATPPSGAVLQRTTGSAPVLKVGGGTGPLQKRGATGTLNSNLTGSAPIAGPAPDGVTGIPVQPPKSRKTVYAMLAISLITILGAISFVVISNKNKAADAKRFLELSKMEVPKGTEEDVDLALQFLTSDEATIAEKTDARKILVGFDGGAADTKVLAALQESENSALSRQLAGILSERGYQAAVPAMLAAFRKVPTGDKFDNTRISLLGSIRQIATDKTVPEMMKALSGKHDQDVRRVIEDIILAVLRQQGNGKAVTSPLLEQASRTTNGDERQSLFRILGLLGGEEAKTRLDVVFKRKGDDPEYQRNAMIALNNWQNRDVLPLIEEIATTTQDEALRLVALRAYLRVASLPAPIPAAERIESWQKALDLTEVDARRMGNELRKLITAMMDYPDAGTEAKLKELAEKPLIGGLAKSALASIEKTRAGLIEVAGTGELPASRAGVRGDGRAVLDRFSESISGWISPETYFTWYFKVKESGTYKIEVLQATPVQESSEFHIIIGEQKLTGQSAKTDSYEDFKPVTLDGEVTLEAGTNYTLFLRAGTKVQPRMMNIKSVQLVKK